MLDAKYFIYYCDRKINDAIRIRHDKIILITAENLIVPLLLDEPVFIAGVI